MSFASLPFKGIVPQMKDKSSLAKTVMIVNPSTVTNYTFEAGVICGSKRKNGLRLLLWLQG
jgi:hypothetical protein